MISHNGDIPFSFGPTLTRTSKYPTLYSCHPLEHLDFTLGAPDLRLHLKGNKGTANSHVGSVDDEEKDAMEEEINYNYFIIK